jgi:hypothetical protein
MQKEPTARSKALKLTAKNHLMIIFNGTKKKLKHIHVKHMHLLVEWSSGAGRTTSQGIDSVFVTIKNWKST